MAEEKPKKKWIKSATKESHGQFREKAERHGESTDAYASEHEHDSGKLGKEARLAKNLMGMHHGAKKHASSRHIMNSFYGHKE